MRKFHSMLLLIVIIFLIGSTSATAYSRTQLGDLLNASIDKSYNQLFSTMSEFRKIEYRDVVKLYFENRGVSDIDTTPTGTYSGKPYSFLITLLGSIVWEKCSDGIPYNSCSPTQPLFCEQGKLNSVNNCQKCGCPPEGVCQADGSCTTACGYSPACTQSTVDTSDTNCGATRPSTTTCTGGCETTSWTGGIDCTAFGNVCSGGSCITFEDGICANIGESRCANGKLYICG